MYQHDIMGNAFALFLFLFFLRGWGRRDYGNSPMHPKAYNKDDISPKVGVCTIRPTRMVRGR